MKKETAGNSMSCVLVGHSTLKNTRVMQSSRKSKRYPVQHCPMLITSSETRWSPTIDVRYTMVMHLSLIARPRPQAIERMLRRMSQVGAGTSILTFSGAAS